MLREVNAVRNRVQAEVAKDGVFRALAPETGLPLPCAAVGCCYSMAGGPWHIAGAGTEPDS